MALRDQHGETVDVNWLSKAAVKLLESAMAADEIDHAACARYIESLTKTLLPKMTATEGKNESNSVVESARAAAQLELREKRA